MQYPRGVIHIFKRCHIRHRSAQRARPMTAPADDPVLRDARSYSGRDYRGYPFPRVCGCTKPSAGRYPFKLVLQLGLGALAAGRLAFSAKSLPARFDITTSNIEKRRR